MCLNLKIHIILSCLEEYLLVDAISAIIVIYLLFK